MRQHAAVGAADPEIEIDGIGGEDDAETMLGMGEHGILRSLGGGDDGGVGRPPAHVAGALVEIAVDDLDGVAREIDQPLAARLGDHAGADLAQFGTGGGELRLHVGGEAADLHRHRFHLGGDDAESLAGIAGARRLDRRVEGEDAGLRGDRGDRAALRGGDLGGAIGQRQHTLGRGVERLRGRVVGAQARGRCGKLSHYLLPEGPSPGMLRCTR